MRAGAYTDVGKVRQVNEDCFYIPKDILKDIPLFIVADGMGGHNAGEIASKEAINTIAAYITENFKNCMKDRDNLINLLKDSIRKANEVIYRESLTDSASKGMGTTLAAVLIYNRMLYIAHVGDSRVYVIRNGGIHQITKDHSYVEQLVRNGTITKKQALNHPQRNIITRALGTDETVEIDINIKRFLNNDTFIICSDGLTNMVTDDKIIEEGLKALSPENLAKKLVDLANDAGGTDNITVIVIEN